MKQNENGDKMSLSELVRRLREQADALEDEENDEKDEESEKDLAETVSEDAESARPDSDLFESLYDSALPQEYAQEEDTAEVETTEPTPSFASARYRFRVTKQKRARRAADAVPAEAEEKKSDASAVTAEVPTVIHTVRAITEMAEAAEDEDENEVTETLTSAETVDGDTRPIEDLPDPESSEEGSTLEFDAVELKKNRESRDSDLTGLLADIVDMDEDEDEEYDSFLETEESERYLPNGAQMKLQDTGDITYVYDSAEGAESEENEELVPPEVDETDVNLMIAFGMDDELAKTIGEGQKAKVEKQIYETEKKMREAEEEATAFEYTSPMQNRQIFRDYKKKYRGITVKIAVCALLLLVAFLYENIAVFGGTLADAINPQLYPVTHIMIDLQIVMLGAALMWRRVLKGLLSAIKLRPTPDSLLTLLLLATVLYDAAMCVLPYGDSLCLYGFPMLLCMMIGLIFELYNLKREIFSFNIVASKRIKFTIGRLEDGGAELEEEAFREYLPEDPNIFKLNKASFVDGFYARMKPSGRNRKVLMLLIAFAFALTAAMLGIGVVFTKDTVSGIRIGYSALMMCMPITAYLTYSLPFYRASQIAYEQDSAILGEGAIDEYAEASSISFDDRDVFPSYGVKVRSIKVFGNHRIDNIIYHAASVFRVAGGPLSDVFDIATADLGHSEDVRLLSVDNDGIEAVVSGTHLYFGKDEYLRRNHFAPLVDDDDGQVGNASIMYMVSDDEVVAKMYIQYRIDPDFEVTLKQLYRYGICVGIKTFDPNIDDEMLSRRIKLDKYPVRILKCREAEDHTKVLEHTESSLVSKHSAKALLKAFTLCSKVQRMIRTDVAINVISMLMGALVMLLALAFQAAHEVPSFYIALYQLFWAIPMYLLAKMTIL